VKFVCGTAKGDILAPGEYWTAINVLNQHYKYVKFRKKISIALPKSGELGKEEPGEVEDEFEEAKLGPDQALEIDRKDIEKHAEKIINGVEFIKGFVIIHSPIELDVVAVYTAIGKEASLTMHMERVLPRLG
jgi:hypothetical protein